MARGDHSFLDFLAKQMRFGTGVGRVVLRASSEAINSDLWKVPRASGTRSMVSMQGKNTGKVFGKHLESVCYDDAT